MVYPVKAVGSNNFKPTNIAVTSNNEIQPDITYNASENNFCVTSYDSTAQKLPLIVNGVNMVSPNTWIIRSTGYNDSANLIAPFPKIIINQIDNQSIETWNAKRANGNGEVIFDAENSTYTNVPDFYEIASIRRYGTFPNPCNSLTTIEFDLYKAENVTIDLYNLEGALIRKVADQNYPSGISYVGCNMSNIPSGYYLYKIKIKDSVVSGKIIVIR